MSKLTPPKSSGELVDMYYHDMRSHLLEVAAFFDRVERSGQGDDDSRLRALREVGLIALGEKGDRARRLLRKLSVE